MIILDSLWARNDKQMSAVIMCSPSLASWLCVLCLIQPAEELKHVPCLFSSHLTPPSNMCAANQSRSKLVPGAVGAPPPPSSPLLAASLLFMVWHCTLHCSPLHQGWQLRANWRFLNPPDELPSRARSCRGDFFSGRKSREKVHQLCVCVVPPAPNLFQFLLLPPSISLWTCGWEPLTWQREEAEEEMKWDWPPFPACWRLWETSDWTPVTRIAQLCITHMDTHAQIIC